MYSSRNALPEIDVSLGINFKQLVDGVDILLGGLRFVSGGEGNVDRVAGDLSELLVHRY